MSNNGDGVLIATVARQDESVMDIFSDGTYRCTIWNGKIFYSHWQFENNKFYFKHSHMERYHPGGDDVTKAIIDYYLELALLSGDTL